MTVIILLKTIRYRICTYDSFWDIEFLLLRMIKLNKNSVIHKFWIHMLILTYSFLNVNILCQTDKYLHQLKEFIEIKEENQ